MKLFTDKDIKHFFQGMAAVFTGFFILAEGFQWLVYRKISLLITGIFLLMITGVLSLFYWYFRKKQQIMEQAVSKVKDYLKGNTESRIECNEEGELYQLFHVVNTLASVLNAHAANEAREKEFLKNTISDISHQLKTPLAALYIYNGLLQDEAEKMPEIKKFAKLSEQELDRMETLVQNLLKITRLDAGTMVIERKPENISQMMKDLKLQFMYRGEQEEKKLIFSGSDQLTFDCDRDWLMEALGNIVKNALDHTGKGDCIYVEWQQFGAIVQIQIKDTGSGIHPEDLNYIFKRFYRSRFSKDKQGIGLGLPLAKAIITAHDGNIEVRSQLGAGTTFTISFLIPTKL